MLISLFKFQFRCNGMAFVQFWYMYYMYVPLANKWKHHNALEKSRLGHKAVFLHFFAVMPDFTWTCDNLTVYYFNRTLFITLPVSGKLSTNTAKMVDVNNFFFLYWSSLIKNFDRGKSHIDEPLLVNTKGDNMWIACKGLYQHTNQQSFVNKVLSFKISMVFT